MADLFQPGTTFVSRLAGPDGVCACLFHTPAGPLLVAWVKEDHTGHLILTDRLLRVLDIQGNPLPQDSPYRSVPL